MGVGDRIVEIETAMKALRQIIESKANSSDIIKIHETKCSKSALRDLVVNLVLFKDILAKHLPLS